MAQLQKLDEQTYWFLDEFVSCFLLIGDKKALWIDSGVTGENLVQLGKEVTDLPQELLNTHSDRDHVAGNHFFKDYYMHSADHHGEDSFLAVKEGDRIDLGGRILEIWEIPGHTKGSIAIYDEKARRLFAGDSVQTGQIYMFGDHRAPEQFADSLKKICERVDRIDEIIASHGEPVLSSDYAEKVLQEWMRVQAGTCEKERMELYGNPITLCKGEACGFLMPRE